MGWVQDELDEYDESMKLDIRDGSEYRLHFGSPFHGGYHAPNYESTLPHTVSSSIEPTASAWGIDVYRQGQDELDVLLSYLSSDLSFERMVSLDDRSSDNRLRTD